MFNVLNVLVYGVVSTLQFFFQIEEIHRRILTTYVAASTRKRAVLEGLLTPPNTLQFDKKIEGYWLSS